LLKTVQHTSASLTINENYDSDVLDDVETWLTGTVPEVNKILVMQSIHPSGSQRFQHLYLSLHYVGLSTNRKSLCNRGLIGCSVLHAVL